MIEGNAMRRLAVKKSARPHAVAATAAGASGLGPPRSPRSVTIRPRGLADRLANPADREQQDDAGDRDEDVVEAGDEAELLFVDRRCGAIAVEIIAERGGGGGV